jgi:hypothetical protein
MGVVGNLLLQSISLVLGAVIAVVISLYFFKKQTKDLESKVYRLEQLITVLAHYLKREGFIEDLELDEKGVLKGFTQTIEPPPVNPPISSGESLGGGELTHQDDRASDTTDEQS